MEDVTDIVFRKVIAKAQAPDVYFTEFTNSESFYHAQGQDSLKGRLLFSSDEKPIVAHIWGDKPEYFKLMSLKLKELGFSGIDINMGCPVSNVTENKKGAGLILRPDFAAKIIQASKASELPVSVKTRLGFYKVEEWKDWLSHLLSQDLANLSIHLRSKKEMSDYPAHWELISDMVKLRDKIAPNTLLTINGDIDNYQTGMMLVKKYGFDGVMIGRGVFKNPFVFEKEVKAHNSKDLLNLLHHHLDLYEKYTKIEPQLKRPLHRFFKIYIKNFKGAKDLRIKLANTKSIDEIRKILEDFEKISFKKETRA